MARRVFLFGFVFSLFSARVAPFRRLSRPRLDSAARPAAPDWSPEKKKDTDTAMFRYICLCVATVSFLIYAFSFQLYMLFPVLLVLSATVWGPRRSWYAHAFAALYMHIYTLLGDNTHVHFYFPRERTSVVAKRLSPMIQLYIGSGERGCQRAAKSC